MLKRKKRNLYSRKEKKKERGREGGKTESRKEEIKLHSDFFSFLSDLKAS